MVEPFECELLGKLASPISMESRLNALESRTKESADTLKEMHHDFHQLDNTVTRMDAKLTIITEMMQGQVHGLTDMENRMVKVEQELSLLKQSVGIDKAEMERRTGTNRWLIGTIMGLFTIILGFAGFVLNIASRAVK